MIFEVRIKPSCDHTFSAGPNLMCPSSWALNSDNFPFFRSSIAHLGQNSRPGESDPYVHYGRTVIYSISQKMHAKQDAGRYFHIFFIWWQRSTLSCPVPRYIICGGNGQNEAFCVKWGPFQQFGPHEDHDRVLNWGLLWKHRGDKHEVCGQVKEFNQNGKHLESFEMDLIFSDILASV